MARAAQLERLGALLSAAGLLACAPRAAADEDHPLPYPTGAWAVTQLIPSPEVASSPTGLHFGLRWQLTPALYSFGIHRGLSPWRFAVVEPFVRQVGSIEWFLTPEYLSTRAEFDARWAARTGLRTYLPIAGHGERLSVSYGTSALLYEGKLGAAYELGAYTLFGTVGLQFTYSPTFADARTIFTFRVRYF